MIPKEDIPDPCRLLYRIHRNNFRDGDVLPGAFREVGAGEERSMSADWGKYSTPNDSRDRASIPADNGIISLIVDQLRNLSLQVIHSPSEKFNNPAHTDVKGIDQNKNQIRFELKRILTWVIDIRSES